MPAPLKIVIDINVVLDTLQRREPYYSTSAGVLAAAETGAIQGCLAAHTITTLYYLIAKDLSSRQAKSILTDLMQFLSIVPIDQATIEQALNLPIEDFEDAVQVISAIRTGAQFLVTRNVRDYKDVSLPVIQPAELLALL